MLLELRQIASVNGGNVALAPLAAHEAQLPGLLGIPSEGQRPRVGVTHHRKRARALVISFGSHGFAQAQRPPYIAIDERKSETRPLPLSQLTKLRSEAVVCPGAAVLLVRGTQECEKTTRILRFSGCRIAAAHVPPVCSMADNTRIIAEAVDNPRSHFAQSTAEAVVLNYKLSRSGGYR